MSVVLPLWYDTIGGVGKIYPTLSVEGKFTALTNVRYNEFLGLKQLFLAGTPEGIPRWVFHILRPSLTKP
jgi:hypothetical protein